MNESSLQVAQRLFDQGQFTKAEQVLTAVLKNDARQLSAIALMADLRAATQGPKQAVAYLELKAGDRPDDPELLERLARYQAGGGDLQAARDSYARYLNSHPGDAPQWLALGEVLTALNLHQDAANASAKAIESAPQSADGYLRLGQILQQFKSYPQAIEVYQQGLLQIPDDARLQGDLAAALKDTGEVEKADKAFKAALVSDPKNAITHYNLGVLKSELGDFELACKHLREALRLQPRFARAYQQLAYMLPADQDDAELIERMENLAHDANMPPDGQARVLFAAARLHENQRRYRRAFKAYGKANAIRAKTRPFDYQEFVQAISRDRRVFTTSLLSRFPAPSAELPRVVVIMGAPRTGTTLIDQMLTGHPLIESVGENTFMTKVKGECMRRFKGMINYPDCLQNCSPIDLMELRELWLRQARAIAPGAQVVVDKTLNNYLNVGLFKLLFPDCVFVATQRQWQDVKLSMFFSDFQEGHEYAFTAAGLEQFNQQFQALMADSQALLGASLIPVSYERLVVSPKAELRPIFQALDLQPHPDMLSFYQRRNQVRTLSQKQVRQKLHSSAIGKYRHYEKFW